MAYTQGSQQQTRHLVEERYFDIRLGETGSLLKEAIQDAAGMAMEELAPGMWVGSKQVAKHTRVEVTARAQRQDDGTSVELRVEHKTSPLAMAMGLTGLIIACCFIIPIIPIVMWAQKAQEKQTRERLVLMHKMWTELGEVVGSPKRAGYRDVPRRVATTAAKRARLQAGTDEQAAEAEAAELEAAAAEAEALAEQAR
jgi:hypothetical protein